MIFYISGDNKIPTFLLVLEEMTKFSIFSDIFTYFSLFPNFLLQILKKGRILKLVGNNIPM